MCLKKPELINRELRDENNWYVGYKVLEKKTYASPFYGSESGKLLLRIASGKLLHKENKENFGFHVFLNELDAKIYKTLIKSCVVRPVLYRKPIMRGTTTVTSGKYANNKMVWNSTELETVTVEEMIVL